MAVPFSFWAFDIAVPTLDLSPLRFDVTVANWICCDEFPKSPDDTKGKYHGELFVRFFCPGESSDGRGMGGIVFCDTVSSFVMLMVNIFIFYC